MDFIDRLRQKPAGTRKRIAYATSAVVTLVIFGVWLSVFHFGLNQKPADATASAVSSSDTDVNPFAALWSVISSGWDGLTNNINQIKTGVETAKDFVGALSTTTPTTTSTTSPISAENNVIILSGTSTEAGQITQ